MPLRNVSFAPEEYYHICNRGVSKKKIFLDQRDYARFLFIILHLQSPTAVTNPGKNVSRYIRSGDFGISKRKLEEIIENRFIDLVSFAIMPNHFHLLIKERTENGVVAYMQKIQNAYAKYFNVKYKKSGHVFQGPYRARHIENNNDLLHVSAYIHRNPRELSSWRNKEDKYPWSSYKYIVSEPSQNAHLLQHSIISEQFTNEKYRHFVETSGTKEFDVFNPES